MTRHKPGELETLIMMIKMRMRLAGHQVSSTKYQLPSTTGELVMVKMRMLGTTVARVEKQKSFTLCSQQRKQTTLPEDKPRRLIEGSVQAGQDVDKAVEDDQIVDSRSLLP